MNLFASAALAFKPIVQKAEAAQFHRFRHSILSLHQTYWHNRDRKLSLHDAATSLWEGYSVMTVEVLKYDVAIL